MSEIPPKKVVLFPPSLDYYEKEITSLIEREYYEQAMALCNWLLEASDLPSLHIKKLQALHSWLGMLLPASPHGGLELGDGEGQDEQHMRRESIQTKAMLNPAYPSQLLRDVREGSFDKQMIALEQLAHIDNQETTEQVRLWLEHTEHHPFLQFRALQTLKSLKQSGTISFLRAHDTLAVRIEDTPLQFNQFPSSIVAVCTQIQDRADHLHPDFDIYAQQTWMEFLTFHYGTAFYQSLEHMNEEAIAIWASAFHVWLAEELFGDTSLPDILERYGIASSQLPDWQEAFSAISNFIQLPLK